MEHNNETHITKRRILRRVIYSIYKAINYIEKSVDSVHTNRAMPTLVFYVNFVLVCFDYVLSLPPISCITIYCKLLLFDKHIFFKIYKKGIQNKSKMLLGILYGKAN